MPSYIWLMTHSFLYWLGVCWWCLGFARASLLCMSKTCLLLMHSSWPGGLFTHPVVHPWLFMAWAVFWFFFMVCSPYRARLCLIVGFSFFSPLFCSFLQSCYHFLLHYSAIPTMMSFDPSLLGLFRSTAYSSLNDSIWSLGSLLHCLRAHVSHLFPLGHP